jgi:hypothetical protein
MSSLVPKEEYKKRLIKIIDSVANEDQNVSEFKTKLENAANFGDVDSNPDIISFEIEDINEKAFQRATLSSKITLLDFKHGKKLERVEWLDGELPVVLNKSPRRPCIDLIGSLDGIPIICELKFSNNSNSNSPIYATIQLLTYYCFIQFNAEFLDKYNVFHKNLGQFKWSVIVKNGFPRLIVCANKSYWNAWEKKIPKNKLRNKVFDWGIQLDTNINLFQSENFDFEAQKGSKKNYTPSIPTNSIWEII